MEMVIANSFWGPCTQVSSVGEYYRLLRGMLGVQTMADVGYCNLKNIMFSAHC